MPVRRRKEAVDSPDYERLHARLSRPPRRVISDAALLAMLHPREIADDPEWPAPRSEEEIEDLLRRLPWRLAAACAAIAVEMHVPFIGDWPVARHEALAKIWRWVVEGRALGVTFIRQAPHPWIPRDETDVPAMSRSLELALHQLSQAITVSDEQVSALAIPIRYAANAAANLHPVFTVRPGSSEWLSRQRFLHRWWQTCRCRLALGPLDSFGVATASASAATLRGLVGQLVRNKNDRTTANLVLQNFGANALPDLGRALEGYSWFGDDAVVNLFVAIGEPVVPHVFKRLKQTHDFSTRLRAARVLGLLQAEWDAVGRTISELLLDRRANLTPILEVILDVCRRANRPLPLSDRALEKTRWRTVADRLGGHSNLALDVVQVLGQSDLDEFLVWANKLATMRQRGDNIADELTTSDGESNVVRLLDAGSDWAVKTATRFLWSALRIGEHSVAATAARQDILPQLAAILPTCAPASQSRIVKLFLRLGADAEPALPGLIWAISHANIPVKLDAIRALGRLGPPAAPALPMLRELLKFETKAVADAARWAISRISNAPHT